MSSNYRNAVGCALAATLLAIFIGVNAGSGRAATIARTSSPPSSLRTQPAGRFVGNKECIKLVHDKHLPPLIHSQSAPSSALTSELSLLRSQPTSLDSTSLGAWDRYPDLISTIFSGYKRVFDGPDHVQIAFVPVTYCDQTLFGSTVPGVNSTARETLEQAMMMFVLSNPGDHPPVTVGTAPDIKAGEGLAGLDLANHAGWVQTIVVPDGVSRVVMHFPAAAGPKETENVAIHENVGIVVRGRAYTPTTVQLYGPGNKLLKTVNEGV